MTKYEKIIDEDGNVHYIPVENKRAIMVKHYKEVNGKMREHVWNPTANDLSSEMTITPLGTMKYAKQGTWVMTSQAAIDVITERDGMK